ncbi:hypothetical protein GJ744_002581 [Endocarpon pusillum]|uniref:Uncharacterized protein n=1 Tax=Endocarpon pusillum TaxID=364733 RepID=A0A8H7E136_9EURO|nr:hypothetical protein GJ744_002581 [Endocarpon pusillum]
MQRFGVAELVPPLTQPPSDISVVGSLGVGGLGLATNTDTNGSDAFGSTLNSDRIRQRSDLEMMHSSTSTRKDR